MADDSIAWNGSKQMATLKGVKAELRMVIGKREIFSNASGLKTIDVAPMLVDPGRTMLPARYVAEGLGYDVDWDPATQTVVCWPAGQPKPDVSAAVQYLSQAQEQPQVPVQVSSRAPYGGYNIPANTDLILAGKDGYPKGQIDFLIQLKKGDLQQQYADARSILSQAVDQETVDKAINHAKQVENALLYKKPWDIVTFNSTNGMAVRVGGGWGYTVEFQVWHTN